MLKTYFFDKINDIKDKFKRVFLAKKKISALENFSSCSEFHHKDYLVLIKRCLKDGFITDEESHFLGYMVDKYEINFLDWAHKTKWLKQEIQDRRKTRDAYIHQQITIFDYLKPSSRPEVPVGCLIASQGSAARGLRA